MVNELDEKWRGGPCVHGLSTFLNSRNQFVGGVTASWTSVAGIALVVRKVWTGSFGSPEFVAVALLAPIVAVLWSLAMWKFFIRPKLNVLTAVQSEDGPK